MILSWAYCVRLAHSLRLFSARFDAYPDQSFPLIRRSTNGCCVEGSGDRGLSGLESDAGSLHPSGRCIVSSYPGVPSHQSDGYCPGHGYGQNLKVGRTVGTKQGMGHFGLVLCARLTVKTNQRSVSRQRNREFLSYGPVVRAYRSPHRTFEPEGAVRTTAAV